MKSFYKAYYRNSSSHIHPLHFFFLARGNYFLTFLADSLAIIISLIAYFSNYVSNIFLAFLVSPIIEITFFLDENIIHCLSTMKNENLALLYSINTLIHLTGLWLPRGRGWWRDGMGVWGCWWWFSHSDVSDS